MIVFLISFIGLIFFSMIGYCLVTDNSTIGKFFGAWFIVFAILCLGNALQDIEVTL